MNKIEFKTSNGKFCLLQVNKDYSNFRIIDSDVNEGERLVIFKWNNQHSMFDEQYQWLLNHQIIGFISELTEEQCQEVVEEIYIQGMFSDEYVYKNYLSKEETNEYNCFTLAKYSFKSLCESLNVDLTQNWLLIKML